MRFSPYLAVAAPLALLAACGRSTPADEANAVPMRPDVAELDAGAELLPNVPEDALESVDFAGAYTREAAGGTERMQLDPEADTWEFTAPDGTVTSGSFTRMGDNRRLAIEDFEGQAAFFSVAEGSIFRLADADTPPDEITVTSRYRRDDDSNPAQATGPGATVDNVADRRE